LLPARGLAVEDSIEMKIAGFLLLLTGWLLVLAAVVLLAAPAARSGFVLAGVGVEILGLLLVFRAHSSLARERH
jgi:uncharacterized membrane protein